MVFDAMGLYNRALQVGLCVGLPAGLVQMSMAFMSVLPASQPKRLAWQVGI